MSAKLILQGDVQHVINMHDVNNNILLGIWSSRTPVNGRGYFDNIIIYGPV